MDFTNNKDQIHQALTDLMGLIDELLLEAENRNDRNPILKAAGQVMTVEELKEVKDNLEMILRMVARNKMKCVFFGKTSNGKSATINAVLRKEVLPSNIGRTTSCFISIEGCDEGEGYLMDKNGKKRTMRDICDLADELTNGQHDINTEITLHWPKRDCDLLREEIQLLDSPGVDYSPSNDKWIHSFCQDADVFVYVVDAGSTINETERLFFRKVKYRLQTPTIFIIMNKWDQCIKGKSDATVENLKKQHRETAQKFFTEDLKLPCDLDKRVFFVSSKEALENDRSDEQYVVEFKKFVGILLEELSTNAITTKFKPSLLKAMEYVDICLQAIDNSFKIKESPDSPSSESQFRASISKMIKDTFKTIRETSKTEIEAQYSETVSSIPRGHTIDSLYFIVVEIFQKYITKILRDTFKGNIESLGLRIKDELKKNCILTISISVLDSYDLLDFSEYLAMFDKDIDHKVSNAAAPMKFAAVKKQMPLASEASETRFIDIMTILTPHIIQAMKHIHPKFEALAPVVLNIATDIEKRNAENKLAEAKKLESQEIPDSLIKTMMVDSLMQFVNENESRIEKDVIVVVNQFLKDTHETSKVGKDIHKIRKRLSDIKEKLMDIKVKL